MRVLVHIALRNLFQARRRTALLGSAIALVSASLILLLSIAHGIEDSLVTSATTLSAGHVNVGGFYKTTATDAAPLITDKAKLRQIVMDNVPGVEGIIERHRGWGKVLSPFGTIQSGLQGVDISTEKRFLERIQLAKESDYVEGGRDEVVGDPSKLAQPRTVMMFAANARKLGVRVGDEVTIQIELLGGATNTLDATLVAVARDVGMLSSFAVLLPTQDVLELYRIRPETTGALWVYLDDIDRAEAVRADLAKVFEAEGYRVMDHVAAPFFFKFDTVMGEDWTGQSIDLTTWEDEVSFLTWVLTAFNAVSWSLVTVLVGIIAVGIMNTLYTSVRERTREIGTMRAIGMTRWQVLGLVLLEAGLLGLGATALGTVAGAAIATGIDLLNLPVPILAVQAILLADTLHLKVVPSNLVAGVVALSTFTALAALWPAWQAASMRPVSAMSHIE